MSVSIPPTVLTGPSGANPFVQFIPPSPQLNASPARPVVFRLTGVWTGLQVVFEASLDLSGAFSGPVALAAQALADNTNQTGTISVPDNPLGQQGSAYTVYPVAGMAVRIRAVSLGSGAPTVDGRDADFFSFPLPVSQIIATATLWELTHIALLLSNLDEKLSNVWQPNPLLPSNFAPGTWDVAG